MRTIKVLRPKRDVHHVEVVREDDEGCGWRVRAKNFHEGVEDVK